MHIGLTNPIDGKLVDFRVNRLIAFAFLDFEGDQDKYDVNHISKDTCDNHIENLEIVNKKEHNRKDHGKPVLGLSINNQYIIFRSQVEACESLGIKDGNITMAISYSKKSGGYNWYHLNSDKSQEIIKTYEQDTTIKGQLQISGK